MAQDIATTDAYVSSGYARKKVEMLFAHLKRTIGLDRLRLRGPNGAKNEFHLAAMVQNLRKLPKPGLRPEGQTMPKQNTAKIAVGFNGNSASGRNGERSMSVPSPRAPPGSKSSSRRSEKLRDFRELQAPHQIGAVIRSGEFCAKEGHLGLRAPRKVLSPSCITLENNEKTRP